MNEVTHYLALIATTCKNHKGGYKPAWIGFARTDKELAAERMTPCNLFVVVNNKLISSN